MSVARPRSCASCDMTGCAMHRRHGVPHPPVGRTAYVLDDAWPEYASMIAASASGDDQILAPGLLGRPLPARYRWPGTVNHRAGLATLRRHLAMRRVAGAAGGLRQRTYLAHDRRVAHALAKAIDYRCTHLVVAQSLLPWLDEAGVLGGRSFDVMMSRYPIAAIHAMLDTVAREAGPSPTIADFRADPALIERETALLDRARTIITPHPDIAAGFPGRATLLAWHRPPATARPPGRRVAFLGPTITRQRPDVVRAIAGGLRYPLVLFGAALDRADFWEGIAIESRTFAPAWLDDIGAILHPAAFTHQPRRLLEAAAHGVDLFATPQSGLDPADFRSIEDFVEPGADPAPRPNAS